MTNSISAIGVLLFSCLLALPVGAAAEFGAARWIAPPRTSEATSSVPLFRKEFSLEAKPVLATLRIIGLGDYDARVNGTLLSRVGMNQPWSQYEKTLYYRDYEVGRLLNRGPNCIGVMLGNSFWHNPNPPAGRYNKSGPQRQAEEPLLLRAELRLEWAGGRRQVLGTDESWTTTSGPITFSHIFAGEDFDARRVPPGWDQPGFQLRWEPARLAKAPPGELRPMFFPAVTSSQAATPVAIEEPAEGVFVYTFARNTAAQLRLAVEGGKSGDRVQFRCGEHKKDKRLFGAYVVGSELITDGKPLERQWTFFYLGMQFVEVTGAVPAGWPNPNNLPVIRDLQLVEVRAGLPETGTFNCSSLVYNGTHEIIDQAMRANMNWVMTDCPHREKLGWLECSYLLAPTFLYRYDGREWFEKIAADIRDAQESSGRVATVAPNYPAGRFPGAFTWTVEWGAAAVMAPWLNYEWFGDREILRANYEMMRRFVDHVSAESRDGLAPGGLGDWYDYGHGQPPGPSRFTPVQLSATATWGLCAQTVSRAAQILGNTSDAETYAALHSRIAAEFRRHYQDPATRLLRHSGSPQCANAMALCANLVPENDRELLVQDIISDLEKRGWQQTPGDIGHVYLIRALAEAGRSDVLHRIYSREGLGSYGGILTKELTSLPETWDAMMDGYQSLNHCMLGHVMEWFYGYVAGIRQGLGSVGWNRVVIGPEPGLLEHADAEVLTPKGRIISRWKKEGDQFLLEAHVPKNIKATAILPSGKAVNLKSGKNRLREQLQ